MDIKIYLATHKKFNVPKDDTLYVPIHNGKAIREDLGYPGDDTGDNISKKGIHFCEQASLYWIWKNDTSKYVGIGTYRRFFAKPCVYYGGITGPDEMAGMLDREDLTYFLSNYDMIVSYPSGIEAKNIREHFSIFHIKEHLEMAEIVLKEFYPEYADTFDKFMQSNCMYPGPIFVAKKELLDRYCEWVFPILFEIDKAIDGRDYGSEYRNRYISFVGERMYNTWILYNKPKLLTLPLHERLMPKDGSEIFSPFKEFIPREATIEAGVNVSEVAAVDLGGQKKFLGSQHSLSEDVDFMLGQTDIEAVRSASYLIIFGLGTGEYFPVLLERLAPFSGQIMVIEPNQKLIQYYLDKRAYLYNPLPGAIFIVPFHRHTVDNLLHYYKKSMTENNFLVSYPNYQDVYRDEFAFIKHNLVTG